MNMALLYEFWRYDIPTEVARGLLEELRIPYEEKISKKRRDISYDQQYDEWSEIYVEKKDLVEWLKGRIETRLRQY